MLGRLLTHELTHLGNVADTLETYEDVRLPFANSVVQQSSDMGRYYSLQSVSADGSAPAHHSPEELNYVRKSIEDAWAWQSESEWVWSDAEERWGTKCRTHAKL